MDCQGYTRRARERFPFLSDSLDITYHDYFSSDGLAVVSLRELLRTRLEVSTVGNRRVC
jgi:hypothetical protein